MIFINRNVESHFAELPAADIDRSRFDRSFSHKTSFNIGQVIPFYLEEVLPGDTFDVTTSAVVRLQTLLTPIMDNVYMDTYYFFCPLRILWSHAKQFFGENTSSAWLPSTSYTIPKIESPENGWATGTIADYLGIPVGVDTANIALLPALHRFLPSALPFRAYAHIIDQWFRDQNLQDPLVIPDGDATVQGVNTGTFTTDIAKGGLPFVAAKYHDYFTSCLPAPLRNGEAVSIFGVNQTVDQYNPYQPSPGVVNPVLAPVHTGTVREEIGAGSTPLAGYVYGGFKQALYRKSSSDNTAELRTEPGSLSLDFEPTNLWADLGSVNITINELRIAFQLQRFYEKLARSGQRYREFIQGMFNVRSPDARMMIPEYLGGHRFPLSIHQVANTSQGETDFLGDLGAMSNTSDVHSDFVKSFTEHGLLIGVCVCRYDHSYVNGLERMWTRTEMLDYYLPVFSSLGETPVFRSEIFYDDQPNTVFGYNECWADYRYKPNRISGELRPGITNSLATWHLSDYYTEAPTLSDSWIREDKTNVDRVLAVTSEVSNQVFCDFYIKNLATRPMPMYSIPGLIDHH